MGFDAPAWRHNSGPDGPSEIVVRLDDFNANATADVVWHNGATSETVIWLMNGTAPTAGYLLSNDPNWSVVP
jgi:hypothetical protein